MNNYKKSVTENVTANYKKAPVHVDIINIEAKIIASKLELDGRIEIFPKREAFININDHKPNFPNNIKCRLINPAKSEVGKISKATVRQNQPPNPLSFKPHTMTQHERNNCMLWQHTPKTSLQIHKIWYRRILSVNNKKPFGKRVKNLPEQTLILTTIQPASYCTAGNQCYLTAKERG